MTTATKDLRIVHASLEVFDTDAQAAQDVRAIVARTRPHLLGGTEAGAAARKAAVREALGDAYVFFSPAPSADGWVAVRRSLIGGDHYRTSYTQVQGSGKSVGDPHHYAAKGVVRIAFDHPRLGHIGFIGGGHYLTKGRSPGQAQRDKPGDPIDHVAVNRQLAHALADAAIADAAGTGLAWVTADTNLIDRTADVFYGRPLTTCWDELGKHPNTGHGNIDVVASVDSDRRVKCIAADVLDDSELRLHTDHFVVATTYRVRKLDPAR